MKVLIAGDYVPQFRLTRPIQEQRFDDVFGIIRPIVESSDYSLLNFESPVKKNGDKPIAKCGPNLSCTEEAVASVRWAGFKCVTLANNHFYDYGEYGVTHTLEACAKCGIDCVGGGMNINEASKVLYKKIGDETLAIINCCEHEFSIATDKTGGSNPLNPVGQYYAIQEAKTKANYVLVVVHGGHEHWQLPSPRMVETYRFFIDAGADAVVNHHQHCFSGYEMYRGKPIFYGLGNLCFDFKGYNDNTPWNYGYMVNIIFEVDKEVSYEIIPYIQCAETPDVRPLDAKAFDDQLKEINAVISDKNSLQERLNDYYEKSSFSYGHNLLEPIGNPYFIGLVRRKMFPSLISKKKRLIAQNYISCEAHRDKLLYYFNNPS